MGTYNHAKLMEGDLVGVRDIGFTAWTIRWKTAGWGQRDDMDVWIHTGVLTDYNSDGHFHIADMYAGRANYAFGVNNIDTYMNGPSGNPSINDLRRSKSIAGTPAVKLWLRSLINSMASKPAKYDWGGLFGGLFSNTGLWNSSSAYLCTEMAYNLICSAEVAAGRRILKNVYAWWPNFGDSDAPRKQSSSIFSRYWPKYGDFNIPAHQYYYREHDWGVIWNTPYIGGLWIPWNMKRACSQGCGWLNRSSFYV